MTTADITVPGTNVEQVLREGGISRFHKKAILVTGAAWTFVAMEILLVGFVAPTFTQIWHLNGRMQGLVNSAALAGSLCGSLVLGRLADRIGRRTIFQYAILWYAVFTAGTALAWGPWSVMTFRFLAGLGLGGLLVVDPSMLAEYLPPQRRGRLLVFLDFWWPVGLLLATGLSFLFLWLPFVLQGEKHFHLDLYLLLALSALSQFPGYGAAIWLVERIGRKPTLAAFLFLGGVSAYAFAAADTQGVYITALFFVGFFNLGAWGAVYPYTAELFPTRLRSSAFGLMEGVGKAAAIAGPYIFGHLKDATGSTTWSISFVAIVMAAGGLVAATFGRETKGRHLASPHQRVSA